MNLFTKAVLISTTVGTVAVGSIAWSGSDNLKNVKTIGENFSNQLKSMADESKAMFNAFNVFKADVQDQLNAKITKINELKAQIEDLKAQLGTSGADNTALQGQIDSLKVELDKANNEAMQLQADFESMETDAVAYVNTNQKQASDLDTSLSLIAETPDAPTGTQTPQAPEQQLPTKTFNNLMDDMNALGSMGMDYSADQWIKVEVGASWYFKTNQEVIDYMTTQETQYDYPTGIQIINKSTGTVLFTTK